MSFDQDYYSLLFLPKTSKYVGSQRQIMVIYPLFKDFNVFWSRLLQSPLPSKDKQVRWHAETNMVICSLCQRLNVFRLRLLKSRLRHPETIKSNGTQRQIWSSAPFVENFNVFRPRLLKSSLRHLLPLLKTQCLSTKTIAISPLPTRDKRVHWHTETNYGHPEIIKSDGMRRPSWSSTPLSKTSMSFDRDYFSLLYHPKIIKSNGMRRPSWSSVFIVFKTIFVSFAIQR